jgi:hypothetical protein
MSNIFSHPLLGKFIENSALLKMKNLIAERETVKNSLDFSDVKITVNDDVVAVQFDSKETVQNGALHYEGFNIIVFHIGKGKIKDFQEYFGFVGPNWFKK